MIYSTQLLRGRTWLPKVSCIYISACAGGNQSIMILRAIFAVAFMAISPAVAEQPKPYTVRFWMSKVGANLEGDCVHNDPNSYDYIFQYMRAYIVEASSSYSLSNIPSVPYVGVDETTAGNGQQCVAYTNQAGPSFEITYAEDDTSVHNPQSGTFEDPKIFFDMDAHEDDTGDIDCSYDSGYGGLDCELKAAVELPSFLLKIPFPSVLFENFLG